MSLTEPFSTGSGEHTVVQEVVTIDMQEVMNTQNNRKQTHNCTGSDHKVAQVTVVQKAAHPNLVLCVVFPSSLLPSSVATACVAPLRTKASK